MFLLTEELICLVPQGVCVPEAKPEIHPVEQQCFLSKGVGGQDLATCSGVGEAWLGSYLTKNY